MITSGRRDGLDWLSNRLIDVLSVSLVFARFFHDLAAAVWIESPHCVRRFSSILKNFAHALLKEPLLMLRRCATRCVVIGTYPCQKTVDHLSKTLTSVALPAGNVRRNKALPL